MIGRNKDLLDITIDFTVVIYSVFRTDCKQQIMQLFQLVATRITTILQVLLSI